MELIERTPAQASHRAEAPIGLEPHIHFGAQAGGPDDPAGQQGWGVRLNLRPGFDLNVFHQPMVHGCRIEAQTRPCLAITVLLSGAGRSEIAGLPGPAGTSTYHPGTLYVSLARGLARGVAIAEANTVMRLVELRMSLPFLERIGSLPVFAEAGRHHRLHRLSTPSLWLGQIAAPAHVLALAEAIARDVRQGGMADLRTESQALALFDAVLALMRTPLSPGSGLRQRDEERLEHARAMMRDRLDHNWSISALARAVGLNEKRLKHGFRQRFGLPVYTALQCDRMARAHDMLRTSDSSVTEISLAVGYANPSHFARLFRRTYGTAPSAARRL